MSKKLIIKAQRGLLYPKEDVFYNDGNGVRQVIKAKKLEGTQLPEGSVVRQSVNAGVGIPNRTPVDYDQRFQTYERTIKYGATPELNDTVYNSPRLALGPVDPKIGFDRGYYETTDAEKVTPVIKTQPTILPVTNSEPLEYQKRDSSMIAEYNNIKQGMESKYNNIRKEMDDRFNQVPSGFEDLQDRINKMKMYQKGNKLIAKVKEIPKGQKGIPSPQGEIREWNPSKWELFWDKFKDNHREGLALTKGLYNTIGKSALMAVPFMDKPAKLIKKVLTYPVINAEEPISAWQLLLTGSIIGSRPILNKNDNLAKKYDPDNSLWKNIIESKLETDSIPESMYKYPFDQIPKIYHDYGKDKASNIQDTYLDSLQQRKINAKNLNE